MDRVTRSLTGIGAIAVPALHTVTDVHEWAHGGFSPAQLGLNYLAFVPIPVILVGLWAAQRPRIGAAGLVGALLYGAAFIYFAHTTLVALDTAVPDYEALWTRLGPMYTAHGTLMVIGGVLFGGATWRAGVVPRWTAGLFLAGVTLNIALALLDVPELLHTLGTALRNAGLAGMGWAVLAGGARPEGGG
jgi:hypothetical protein